VKLFYESREKEIKGSSRRGEFKYGIFDTLLDTLQRTSANARIYPH
jgi:hypothetical protein